MAGNNANTSGAGSLASTVLSGNPLARTEALAGALANYQTTFAQIGRQLNFSAIPRSLATASAAEIAVTLNADESTGGPLYTGGGATDPATNTSRVAQHDTVTRVRVDSIKLFDLSEWAAGGQFQQGNDTLPGERHNHGRLPQSVFRQRPEHVLETVNAPSPDAEGNNTTRSRISFTTATSTTDLPQAK